jgi:glycosyltransferase involved in cell wall biosynthesis
VEPKISIVVPLYNEGLSFPFLIERLNDLMLSNPLAIEVVLVDDASTDNTTQLINQIALTDERYTGLFLARNYGHQIALSAGLSIARGSEAVMIIDGDLQDPPELLVTFYSHLKEGYDVIFGVRKKRKEGLFKRFSYYLFYRIQQKIVNINIPLDSGDFSLISRRVVDILNKMPEESRFIRGMRTWIGFRQIGIEYDRDKRVAGSSKYSLKMLASLAYNGVFNFSDFPIKLITSLGFFTISLSLLFLLVVLIKKIFYHDVPAGYTSLLLAITLFSGVQLISLGIIGEYIYRIFFQVKGRPLFNVKHKIVEKELISE